MVLRTLLLFAGLQLVVLCGHANVYLRTGEIFTSFDVDWGLRSQRDLNATGLVHNGVNFSQPSCTATRTRNFSTTDIIHIHLPWFLSAGCSDVGSLAKSLTSLYYDNSTFAALLVTFDQEETTGSEKTTPWGVSSYLQNTPYGISIGPLSTAVALWNDTDNFTTLQQIRIISDPGPWNDFKRGPNASIYHGFVTSLYIIFIGYGLFLLIDQHHQNGRIVCPFTIKTWILIVGGFFLSFQILSMWLPLYPNVLSSFFFWYSFVFGFACYSLILLIWVKVVSKDHTAKNAMSKFTANFMHLFSYFAILILFLLVTFIVISIFLPEIPAMSTLRSSVYFILPILLVVQSVLFLYYGTRLLRLLTTFSITEEKRLLMRRLTGLMSVAVICFIIVATTSMVNVLLKETLIGAWTSKALRDASLIALILVIFFTLYEGRNLDTISSLNANSLSMRKGSKGTLPTEYQLNSSTAGGTEYEHEVEKPHETRSRSNSGPPRMNIPRRVTSRTEILHSASFRSVDSVVPSPSPVPRLPPLPSSLSLPSLTLPIPLPPPPNLPSHSPMLNSAPPNKLSPSPYPMPPSAPLHASNPNQLPVLAPPSNPLAIPNSSSALPHVPRNLPPGLTRSLSSRTISKTTRDPP